MTNQHGLSSLSLLIILVFGIFILWEINEYIQFQVSPPPTIEPKGNKDASGSATLCITGEAGNCNDSNDQFLLP